jgi:pimeloyl-ACP methyl ester carboxylesterase
MAWDRKHSAIMTLETVPAELDSWSVPTLCLAGSDDVYVPAKAMRAVAAALGDVTVVEFPDTGHWTFWEKADSFSKSVVEFLEKHLV